MSAPIASKNLYDLLGNDPELDPDREPEPPTKAIDKPVARTGKRNGPAEPPARVADASRSTRGSQRDGNSNDSAFKDRGVGSNANRSRGSGEPPSEYRGRGGRGGRGGRRGGPHAPYSGDRHSRTGVVDTEKQVAHGWGGATGGDEWADEKAGEAIAKEDEKTEGVPADADAAEEPAAEAEPEDKTKSYDEYLAELAQKKLGLSANVRKANEGTSKSFPEGKPLNRDDEEDAYIAGSGGKAKRERERKQKTLVELDDSRLHSAPRETFGGRGRGRGRGEFRGGEGRGRGGRGRGEARGRGGRGQSSGGAGPNVTDTRAFPSLGA